MKETDFARYLTQFLSAYLPGQAGSKRNTQLAYRDSILFIFKVLQRPGESSSGKTNDCKSRQRTDPPLFAMA